MSFYRIIVRIVKCLMLIINGKTTVIGRENLPDKPSIIASTHRSLLDPVYLAVFSLPMEISFMAKQSLFTNPFLNWLFRKLHGFPINREKPAPSTLRHAVDVINKEELHLGIFPTGTRYSTEVKGGTAFIQRLSKADIVPIAIQPPRSFWAFIFRQKGKMAIGKPIKYDPNKKYTKDDLKEIDQLIAESFDELDRQLDPNYHYVPKKDKPD